MQPWVLQSVLGALMIAPINVMIGISGKSTASIAILFWYSFGVCVGCFLLSPFQQWSLRDLTPSTSTVSIFIIGSTIGVVANALIFKAAAAAPNPALAFVVAVAASFLAVPLAALVGVFRPEWSTASISMNQCIGVVLMLGSMYFMTRTT